MPPSRAGSTSILQAVEMRGETDTRPSYPLYFVLPFVLFLLGAILAVAVVVATAGLPASDAEVVIERWAEQNIGPILGGIGLLVVAALAGIVLGVIGVYKLIKRRNEHFGRDRLVRQGTIELCRQAAEGDEAHEHITAMERIHNEAMLEENERSAGLHILISFLTFGLWFYYVLWFLMKDLPRHTRRQARFTRHANEAMAAAGLVGTTVATGPAKPFGQGLPGDGDPDEDRPGTPADEAPDDEEEARGEATRRPRPPPVEAIPERSFAMYIGIVVLLPLVGGLIAAGIGIPDWTTTPLDIIGLAATFLFWYWIYTDPNEHFASQWAYEDQLIEIAQQAPEVETPGPEAEMPSPGSSPGLEGSTDTVDEEQAAAEEPPAFTVWACGECGKRYKVPPKRPVRVTCKDCGNQAILRA